jgi:hypothetical protein
MPGTDRALQARVRKTEARLRQVATERGMFVTADDRINEGDAAELLGYAEGTLRNMRSAGGGPCFFNRPLSGFAKSYRLADLASWLERAREETL